jgi:hypothetical protein
VEGVLVVVKMIESERSGRAAGSRKKTADRQLLAQAETGQASRHLLIPAQTLGRRVGPGFACSARGASWRASGGMCGLRPSRGSGSSKAEIGV